jgi:hypothetical protein
MNASTKAWAHGLAAGVIGAFASAASGAITIPGVFNFSHTGLINFAKISLVPAVLAGLAYIKQSPLPALSITATTTSTVTTEVTPTKT